jgi:hypothetical protein
MTITTRSGKGSALSFAELDGNFTDLDNRTKVAWVMDGLEPTVREGSGNPAELTVFRDNVVAYSYVANAMSESYTNWDVPLSWAPGTDLYLAFHWSPGNSTATGSVRWCIEYTGAQVNGTFFPSIIEHYDSATDGTAYKHYQKVSTPFPGDQTAPNMRFLIRIFRDGAAAADTFPDPAFLLGVDFYYQVSKFGTPSFTPPYT